MMEVGDNQPLRLDSRQDRPSKIILSVSNFVQKSKLASGPTQLTPGVTINGQGIDLNQNCTAPSHLDLTSMEGDTFYKKSTTSPVVSNGSDRQTNGDTLTQGEGSPLHTTNTDVRLPTEEELLKQLEEANRMLEADEKSHIARAVFSTTPGHSRKGSGSSIVSSTSSNSFYSPQNSNEGEEANGSSSETLWDIWGRIINDWDSVKKKPTFLKELVRKGIPHEFRGMAWQMILGVNDSPYKQEYAEHMKKTSPSEKLIRRDIARTFPDHDFFKEKDGFGQESLFNVMKAYSLHDREVGYCQGSGFIVGLLLMQMPEEDAFAVLVRLMQDFRLRELFKPSMAELGLCMFKLECLIQELLPTLLIHFQTQNFDTSMYASSWFLTLYVTSLPLSLARRIMDLFVSEGMEIIFRVGVAILQSCQEDLLALDMEGLLKYLQKDLRSRFEQEPDQENLLSTAYSIKYSQKKMKKLEKEYTALKTKENEDQIELRRLRTENRLLRQRIENLEKESTTLADKLVQDQVTWAQEVEQSYALRNELSITRLQLQETQKKLLDAEDIIGDIRKRTRIIEDAVHLDEAEECNMVKYLQEELIAVRLREAETAGTIKELRQKIVDLEDTNLRLQRAPSNDVQQLQEELIAVKLREAEANLSMKELRMKVNEIESYWESHMERIRQASPKDKGSKAEVKHLQEELMALKIKEAKSVADLKDAKQKLMELETQNQICTNQIRRMVEDNKELKKQLEEALERERDLKSNIKDLTRKLDDTESQRKEEAMMSRIKEAENVQQLEELRHKIAEIDIQKEELLAAGQLHDKGENQELENKLADLQDEVLQLQLSFSSNHTGNRSSIMTDSFLGNNSDEEVDAEIKDSENLDQTLSDIIEGRSKSCSSSSVGDTDESSTSVLGVGHFLSPSRNNDLRQRGLPTDISSAHTVEDTIHSSPDHANSMVINHHVTSAADAGGDHSISGEKNVKEKAQRRSTQSLRDLSGKTCAANSGVCKSSQHSVASGKIYKDKMYVTAIADPGQSFPEGWELYDEVVVLDADLKAKVITRNSSDREVARKANKTELNSGSDKCTVSAHQTKTLDCHAKEILTKIPDVVVIYEPSCSGIQGCEEGSSELSDFYLKESTV
ncbi:EVI5-like protein isoform X4 [Biomphalaria glabrata]|uniref:EVI5-like protein isoform X4 n=1 Tax=Biomphalaria glabrata TaxID=6526 RepID=A0A9W3BAU5_BIOGL|nr:EVI5-like protein isoform X4 [Biomphalaria glabrata]